MYSAKVLSVSVFLIGIIFLAGCGVLNSSNGVNLPPGAPKPGEFYIPPTTKVLDADSRAALQSFGKEGNLLFNRSTALLASLAIGDIVVSEPAGAAPNGLLRKVVSILPQGDQLIVTTADAQLQEAIPQGKIDFVRHLDQKDIVPGQSLPSNLVNAQSWTIPFSTDFNSNGIITMSGNVTIDPTITLNIQTFCSQWTEVKVKIPYTNTWIHFGWLCTSHGIEVTSSLALNEQANVTIAGTSSFAYQNDIDIATYNLSAITFFVGPVPVVLTPKIVIYIGVDGTVSASLSVSATQTADLIAGFHYKTGVGFNDLSQTTGTFAIQNPTYSAHLDIGAYAGVKFEIFLYGLVGPYGALEAGPEFEASMTGIISAAATASANEHDAVRAQTGPLLWELKGCITLSAGIDSVAVLDIHYDKDLYEACTTFASHENEPPAVTITAPTGGTNKTNLNQNLTGTQTDPEGGPVTCVWSSDKQADNFVASHVMSTSCNGSVTFLGYGSRTLTLTGTDQAGASASATVLIGIRSPDVVAGPKIEICCAQIDTGFFVVDEPLTLSSPVDVGAAINTIDWSFVCCDTDLSNNPRAKINVAKTLGTENTIRWTPDSIEAFKGLCGVIGTGTITLTLTDPKGAAQKAMMEVTLVRTNCGK